MENSWIDDHILFFLHSFNGKTKLSKDCIFWYIQKCIQMHVKALKLYNSTKSWQKCQKQHACRRGVDKFFNLGGGAGNNLLGIICPPLFDWKGLIDMPSSRPHPPTPSSYTSAWSSFLKFTCSQILTGCVCLFDHLYSFFFIFNIINIILAFFHQHYCNTGCGLLISEI